MGFAADFSPDSQNSLLDFFVAKIPENATGGSQALSPVAEAWFVVKLFVVEVFHRNCWG